MIKSNFVSLLRTINKDLDPRRTLYNCGGVLHMQTKSHEKVVDKEQRYFPGGYYFKIYVNVAHWLSVISSINMVHVLNHISYVNKCKYVLEVLFFDAPRH